MPKSFFAALPAFISAVAARAARLVFVSFATRPSHSPARADFWRGARTQSQGQCFGSTAFINRPKIHRIHSTLVKKATERLLVHKFKQALHANNIEWFTHTTHTWSYFWTSRIIIFFYQSRIYLQNRFKKGGIINGDLWAKLVIIIMLFILIVFVKYKHVKRGLNFFWKDVKKRRRC